MWELELLSRVVPAFGALAREYMRRMEDEHHDARLRDAQDCYQDIVLIGYAVHMSGGEWTSGLDDIDVARLLAAFETRFPKKRFFLPPWKSYGTPEFTSAARTQFPKLANVADSIESRNLGGYKECYEILSQSEDQHKTYVNILGPDVSLFRGSELADFDKREKFLKRIQVAANHLLDVYCREEANGEVDSLSLSQHPSHGAKESADKLYKSLQRHWSCSCPPRATETSGTREARLSLTRYRQFAPRVPRRPLASLSFEVVLPVCNNSAEWKVTNFEVQSMKSQVVPATTRQAIARDLCLYLRKSGRMAQEHFLIEHEDTWHLRAELLEEPGKHASMEPLDQLLGNGVEMSYISRCNPREQLTLCYILATSMLYLYPSSWFSTEWNSTMVHFIRRSKTSTSPALTHPYVSIQLQDSSTLNKPPDRHRIHSHPAILALGIMFLEIASGSKFIRTREDTPTEQCNEDNARALQDFEALERNDRHSRKRQIPSGLREAIRACLKLQPPANFPSNQLADEGPIRYYILSCIVQPLAHELKDGYKIDLSDLHNTVFPETSGQRGDGSHHPTLSRQSTVSIETMSRITRNGNSGNFASNAQLNFASRGATSFAACQIHDSHTWLKKFDNANLHLYALTNTGKEKTITRETLLQRTPLRAVKVAILDTGCDIDHIFFSGPGTNQRDDLVDRWIDCVKESEVPVDDDAERHGTALAALMLRLLPGAELYIVRVAKDEKGLSTAEGTIAEAITQVAKDWDVDIMSLSFGFAHDVKSIHNAILDAEKDHSIMFFAAANNDGRNEPEMFPASMETVISIRGTRHDGSFDPQYNPKSTKHGPQYGSLARDVPCGWISESLTKSGCSIATPIVAAIAGLIISFVDREDSLKEYRDLVRTRKGMLSIFSMMSDDKQTLVASRLDLAPWQLYERHRRPKYLIGHALSNT